MSQRLIAIVEDEANLRENYREALERYGFATRGYASRVEAESALAGPLPDLVIIDIGLGHEPEGGFELCRSLRHRSESLPIIFLTARDSDLDAVSGLRLGADDYLTKDISNQHLLARILALFRRIDAVRQPDRRDAPLRIGAVELEPDTMQVRWNGQAVALTVTEFWMVHCLLERPGHVKSRSRLMEAASLVVDETTVTSHIKRIRRKFENIDAAFDRLETVHGAGYRWNADGPAEP
ncbi:MAG: proteobacterial dedicated sortase system response regulator [Gammaproteobacteria bacterium]|jgi:two-component system OmpR family response regulator|nr:proteobacterial dedicated sortase system response regulator [Gammaproteobacteria bacterium]